MKVSAGKPSVQIFSIKLEELLSQVVLLKWWWFALTMMSQREKRLKNIL
ncbi:MAG: hypothetical protein WC800_04650 [Candidatus Nanopelagicaceae bacterium]